jgi:predicted nuclease with TOPRIM domain|tara:strand:- start:248 stop:472 length:225 start_codon:yes stop_codon:yes gene_type:complete
MSAEQQALQYLNEIFKDIKETLQEVQNNKRDARQLTEQEEAVLKNIVGKIKQVRNNLNDYLKSFRVQTRLDEFN